MGLIRLGPPEDLVLKLRDVRAIRTFVETGTWKAATTLWAAKYFEHVLTIEADDKRFNRAVARHAQTHAKIRWVRGDSKTELSRALKGIHEPAIFWLDAHTPQSHGLGVTECPLVWELQAIYNHRYANDHVILIDDLRFFKGDIPAPWDAENWPTLRSLKSEMGDRYIVEFEDVLIAVPNDKLYRRTLDKHIAAV